MMEHFAHLMKKIHRQQADINKLNEQVQQLRALPGQIYDSLDDVARGFGAIQNYLGEIHQQRQGKRYEGI